MAQYVEGVTGIPILTDLVDADSDKWTQYAAHSRFPLSMIYRREGACLREYERKVCSMSSAVLVTTEREAQVIRDIDPTANIRVIRNGVDSNFFSTANHIVPTPSIIFTGDMSYFPNQEGVLFFCRKVLPLIRQSVPDVRFTAVGRNPSPEIRQLESIPGVKITGFVPDVRTYLGQARLAVVPLSIAAGIQNKILEAMSCGVPVVSSSRAAQGLSPLVAKAVRIADSADSIAAESVRFLQDPELANRVGAESRRLVIADYDWEQSNRQLLDLIENPSQKHTLRSRGRQTVSGN
jgi:sugar transferase (PEP-CTERM/EpsH1 system associated)